MHRTPYIGGIGIAVAVALTATRRMRVAPPDAGDGKTAPKPTTASADGPPDETWPRQRRRAWERKNGGPR
jgi:hypothetical protein